MFFLNEFSHFSEFFSEQKKIKPKSKKLWLKNPNSFGGAKEGEDCWVMVEKT
jgi:hypothetical protein